MFPFAPHLGDAEVFAIGNSRHPPFAAFRESSAGIHSDRKAATGSSRVADRAGM
jgi:hypothetical protein